MNLAKAGVAIADTLVVAAILYVYGLIARELWKARRRR